MLNKRMSSKVAVIIAAIMLGVNIFTLGFQKINHNKEVSGYKQQIVLLSQENKNLLLDIEESETKVINKAVEQIEEDKNSGLKLIVFESKATSYTNSIKEDSMFGAITKSVNTAFKYSAALNMNGVDVVQSQDNKKIYVSFHESMVDVFSVDKGEFKINASKNMFNSFKGTTRDKMSQEIISLADKEINQEVKMDFSQRKEDVLNSIKAKLAQNYGVSEKDIVLEIKSDAEGSK